MRHDRRRLLWAATGAGLGSMAVMASQAWSAPAKKPAQKKPPAAAQSSSADDFNSPPEDLMLEHAVFERLLLIYQEGTRRMRARETIEARVFHEAAELVRKLVEDYHQKREETHIFPLLAEHVETADLVKTLRAQHGIARNLTDRILDAATAARFAEGDGRRIVGTACEAYIRMYRPHMAVESTELFQSLYDFAPQKKVDEIAIQFQKQEERLFGQESLEKMLEGVARLEQELHIEALESYAPQDV